MEKRKLTCVVCPLGCAITAEVEGDNILNISGATCKRGKAYAKTELTDPRRMLTTTMRVKGAGLVPVKSSEALPKALLLTWKSSTRQAPKASSTEATCSLRTYWAPAWTSWRQIGHNRPESNRIN